MVLCAWRHENADPVRVEIETALERKLRIIPVLVDGARMPASSELPSEFGNFAYLWHAAEVLTGRDFRSHMDRLVDAIDRSMTAGSQRLATGRAVIGFRTQAAFAASVLPEKSLDATDALRYLAVPAWSCCLSPIMSSSMSSISTRNICGCQSSLLPFGFGFALFWLDCRGAAKAGHLALRSRGSGFVAVFGMTVSGVASIPAIRSCRRRDLNGGTISTSQRSSRWAFSSVTLWRARYARSSAGRRRSRNQESMSAACAMKPASIGVMS